MMLRLYRVPYFDPIDTGLVRLLFEGTVSVSSEERSRVKFYMYVWVNRSRRVTGFQAVLDEELTATFKEATPLIFGKIGRNPVNRSIEESEEPEIRDSLARAVEGMANPEFPELIEWSARLIRREPVPKSYDLNEQESREFITLTSERPW